MKGHVMFPPILAKYGVEANPMDFGQTFSDLVKAVWKLDESIKASQAATDKSDAPKVVHPFDKKAGADKAAKAIAKNLTDAFLTACDAAIAKNANVAFHLAEVDSNVSAYFTSEVQYYRHKMGDDSPKVTHGNLDEQKSDRKELVEFARMLWAAFPALKDDPKVAGNVELEDGSPKLPSIRGRASQTGESDIPTGRYAGHYKTSWTVDEQTFPTGTDPREIMRAVYKGTERVGKKMTTDLFDLLDKAKPKDYKMGQPVTFKVNGHTVKVEYPAKQEA